MNTRHDADSRVEARRASASTAPSGISGRITLVLGRFDPLVAVGLSRILDEDHAFQVIRADVDDTALELVVARGSPQVAVLDEESVDGLSLLRRLRSARPAIATVVLAHSPTRAYGMRLLAAGAICIAKDASAAEIIDTIHRAANSEIPHFGANGAVAGERYFTGLLSLTPRELEVLGCLSDGQTHKQIADALQISLETARTHTERIRRKLAVRTNRELIGALWWSRT